MCYIETLNLYNNEFRFRCFNVTLVKDKTENHESKCLPHSIMFLYAHEHAGSVSVALICKLVKKIVFASHWSPVPVESYMELKERVLALRNQTGDFSDFEVKI